jgi:hypothetical protein
MRQGRYWYCPPDADCCVSCHEDAENGYDLIAVTLPDGSWADVCCYTANILDFLRAVWG